MSDAEKHDGDQSRDASAEVPQTREERVQACMRLMPAQWERGKTAKRLAAEWGVGINVVEQASAEAWRRLKAQDATVVRETLAVECADSLDLARTIDDPAKSVTARMQVRTTMTNEKKSASAPADTPTPAALVEEARRLADMLRPHCSDLAADMRDEAAGTRPLPGYLPDVAARCDALNAAADALSLLPALADALAALTSAASAVMFDARRGARDWPIGGSDEELDALERLKAMLRGEAAALAARDAAHRAEVDALREALRDAQSALEQDRTGLAFALGSIIDKVRGTSWVAEGRGRYEWDDDRYKEEAGNALSAVGKIAKEALVASGTLVIPVIRAIDKTLAGAAPPSPLHAAERVPCRNQNPQTPEAREAIAAVVKAAEARLDAIAAAEARVVEAAVRWDERDSAIDSTLGEMSAAKKELHAAVAALRAIKGGR